jgi:hypothetical protein
MEEKKEERSEEKIKSIYGVYVNCNKYDIFVPAV